MKRAAKLTTMAMKPKKKSSKLSESKNDIVNSNGSSSISKPLLSLAQLYQGVVVRRPSLHNKSPYVADVTLNEGFKYSTVKFRNVAHLLKWNLKKYHVEVGQKSAKHVHVLNSC